MFSIDFVGFIKNNFPEQLDEISAAVELLVESIEKTEEVISTRANELSGDKEYDSAMGLIEKAKELHALSTTIQSYAEILDSGEVVSFSEDEALSNIEKKHPNYGDYEVDTTVAHTLHESFVHKRPYAFELNRRKVQATDWKTLLVETCNMLAEIDLDIISDFVISPKFSGRKLQYFTAQRPELMRSPRKINGINLHVETNFSANFIRNLIVKMLNQYKIPLSAYKVYLRADYTELHEKPAKSNDGKNEAGKRVDKKNGPTYHQETTIDITDDCIQHISDRLGEPLIKRSRAIYHGYDNKTAVVCLTSRGRNVGRYIEYWFGLRVNQKDVLENAKASYLALGCGSGVQVIMIPYKEFRDWLDCMSISGSVQDVKHWNITVVKKHDSFTLRLKAGFRDEDLGAYILKD